MSMQAHVLKAAFLLLILPLTTMTGCQKQSASDQKGEQSAQSNQVTVAVPGMT
jgi:hypothetical protein